jgi:hypothetical protein
LGEGLPAGLTPPPPPEAASVTPAGLIGAGDGAGVGGGDGGAGGFGVTDVSGGAFGTFGFGFGGFAVGPAADLPGEIEGALADVDAAATGSAVSPEVMPTDRPVFTKATNFDGETARAGGRALGDSGRVRGVNGRVRGEPAAADPVAAGGGPMVCGGLAAPAATGRGCAVSPGRNPR